MLTFHPQSNAISPPMQSKASDDSDDLKKKERAERAKQSAQRREETRRRLEKEIPVASPKELSRLWHNSVELLSAYPEGQTSTAIWVLWETSLRLAALAQKHGTPHDNLASIRAATIGLPGDVAKISYLFSQDLTLVDICNGASVEITRLLIALPDLGHRDPTRREEVEARIALPATTEEPTVSFADAVKGRADLGLPATPRSTLYRWMGDPRAATDLGINPKGKFVIQHLKVTALKKLRDNRPKNRCPPTRPRRAPEE